MYHTIAPLKIMIEIQNSAFDFSSDCAKEMSERMNAFVTEMGIRYGFESASVAFAGHRLYQADPKSRFMKDCEALPTQRVMHSDECGHEGTKQKPKKSGEVKSLSDTLDTLRDNVMGKGANAEKLDAFQARLCGEENASE